MTALRPDKQALATRLRALREARGLLQREVARAAGVTQAYVSHLERGRVGASPATLRRLAAVLGVDPDELLRLAGYEEPPDRG